LQQGGLLDGRARRAQCSGTGGGQRGRSWSLFGRSGLGSDHREMHELYYWVNCLREL